MQFSHHIVVSVLCKLFNILMSYGYVSASFRRSYTIPLSKGNAIFDKARMVDDFRDISISPVLSKIFEHCILDRFSSFLATTDNQFGFKKGLSCSHAIHLIKSVVDEYVAEGSTVNVCALDLSKAFDRINHFALFLKLMNRNTSVNLLAVIEKWFSISVTCVKWGDRMSNYFNLVSGVRQGGVSSLSLFAIYVNDIAKKLIARGIGCHMSFICTGIFLYADDLFFIAPSLHTLQIMLNICETELSWLDMRINDNKSVCMRFGQRLTYSVLI